MPSTSVALLVSGIALTVIAQLLMAINAFSKIPLAGILCLFVPMYVVVYSKKSTAGKGFLKAWWAGLGLLIVGGVMAS
jgi:hypothetical protein